MKNLKKMVYMLILTLSLLMSNIIFAEVPHTTIAENPNKEVTKVETLKRRDKAELNLTVEKNKSKEVIGYVDGTKVIIPKEKNPQVNFEDSYEVIDNLDGKISKGYTITTTEEGIEIEGDKIPNLLYLIGKNETWKVRNWKVRKMIFSKKPFYEKYGTVNIEFNENYTGGKLMLGTVIPVGMKILSTSGECNWFLPSSYTRLEELKVNGQIYSPGMNILNNSKIYIEEGSFRTDRTLRIENMPKQDFSIKVLGKYYYYRASIGDGGNSSSGGEDFSYTGTNELTMNFKYKPNTLKGQSTLIFREKYSTNQYIKFNSTTIDDRNSLGLENSLTDVTFSTSGQGLVAMKEGDKLEIAGKQVTVGSGGNLGVQTATAGNLKYSYKVEGGKLRIALNSWGVLEPDHNLMIRVFRTENGNQRKMVEHTLTIDSPRRVEGTNNIKIDNNYQIRNIIKFNGISLDTPSSFSLESPIPAGITLAEQTGYGIPLLDEGDILQIDDGRTRTVHSYTIQSGGTLPSQRVEFSNGSIDLLVVNRKVQVRLNNWKVNEPMRLNLRAIRGVNEISNHAITLTAPEAPFNMLETGNLDFGNVLQGAKNRKAESNIRIEMLAGQDVSEVKFNLREEQPIMTNSQGTELKVKRIDKTVQKVRDREYNIKLRGTLDVPEEQQSGEYRGSNILDIEVK